MKEKYNRLSEEEKAEFVKNKYDGLDGTRKYATSRDWNLRELEIGFIVDSLQRLKSGSRILDVGCGNGYTDIVLASTSKQVIVGVDFSETMVIGANLLKQKHANKLLGTVTFCLGNVRRLAWSNEHFDAVISERCLLNLPNRKTQIQVINEIARVLKRDGLYVMVEGTRTGLNALNLLRQKVGLKPIEDRDSDNVQSLKFDEETLEKKLWLANFKVLKKQHFGMYYLISRVVHPLLIAPEEPKFNAKINEIARQIASLDPNYKQIGHVVGYVLKKL